jgi:predicted alpha/beta-fold hydrolase
MGTLLPSTFDAPWWLRSPHAQTILPDLARRPPPLPLDWEDFALPDGDFLELAWAGPPDGPIAVILHGLGGSYQSGHIQGLARRLVADGWRVCLFHFRGCARRPNRTLTTYHNGMTGDPAAVFDALAARFPGRPRVAVGISLGGNALLRLLGERPGAVPLDAAAAISVAVSLPPCVARLDSGFSKVYQAALLRRLKRRLEARRALISQHLDWDAIAAARTFSAFDDAFTAPAHGYASAADYHTRASARPLLPQITVPTHILVADDDPFLAPEALPVAAELSPVTTAERSATGGHVGFVHGTPARPAFWLDDRIAAWAAEARRRGPSPG